MLGNGRLEAQCFDGEKRLALIRGKMRKKVWINTGDIILLSLREFQDEKADVIQKYTPDEARGEFSRRNEKKPWSREDLLLIHPLVPALLCRLGQARRDPSIGQDQRGRGRRRGRWRGRVRRGDRKSVV